MGFLKNLKVKKSEEPSPEIAGAIEAANVVFNEKVTPVLLKFEQMDRSRKIALNNTLGRFCELFATVVKPASDIPDRILATTLGFDIETDKLFFASIMGLDSQPSGVGFDSPSSPRNGPSAQNTETGITATSAPLVDEEGFTIVPSQNPPAAWAATKQDDGFDSSDNEDAADTGAFDTAKMKVAISSSVIEDSNPSEAAGVLQNLAASLPNSNRKTNRISMIPSSYNAETTATNSTSYGAPAIPMPLPLSPQISSNTFNSVFGVPTPNASSAKQSIKLAANVVETVNVVIRDGMIEKLLVTGEISISLPFNAQSIPDAAKFKLAISGTDVFEQFVANSAFATPFTGPDGNGLDIELSKLVTHSSSGVVPVAKYQIRVADDDVDFYAPILANPIWKFDDASASLLLAFEYNDDLISRLTLGEVRILATLSDGGDLYNAQMKPEGAFSQERRSILWDIGSLGGQSEPSWPMPPGGSIRSNSSYGSSQGAAPLKVIARVETSSPASAGIVAIQFKANGGLLSGIDVDINDEVVMLNDVSKSVCSGKYVAYP
ncbi:hypothetical protein BCR33DRAFT_187555 [Rhizoclosmatium globosum]|uniref:MHD domain-containing protein n=1 Tax=Rhizoclosmatium globosum TaxID=329046 RepID=A0A1Y2D1N8_9FUNG|nr:hypothetical protein BCR33DRAFT_187555 [Rhizoclosmatium globosum]|eukprot:ORY53117.1 hypothetical protein BCR33DRAFT_187555 [Rhizoclosmatium globosum]